jgi:hypothetical protein
VHNPVFRAVGGAGIWTMFAIWMANRAGADSVVQHALIVGSVGIYAVCAWKLCSRRETPNIQSGPKHDALKRFMDR